MNNIKINKQELLNCLECVISACAPATVNPTLSQVHCQVENNRLTMIATNHELQIKASCACQSNHSFSQLLPAVKLQTILRVLDDDAEVKINFDKETAQLKSKRSIFKLRTLVDSQFTLLGEQKDKMREVGEITSQDLLLGLKSVNYASAKESHRMCLNGVLIEQKGDQLNFVATDGHRLALKPLPLENKGEVKHILPRKTVDILIQRLKAEEKLRINASDTVIEFIGKDFELISNVIDENFPDYESVIPRNNERHVVLPKKEFQWALKRALALSDRSAVVSLQLENNQALLECTNQDNDNLNESLDIQYEKDKIKITFNTLFLTEVFSVIETDQISIDIADEKSGVLIYPQEDKSSFLYVVMPIRV